ncbi:MAG: hypothetical protein JWQ90_955 [Hydrocarboniphaga sp.]|uniref:hypothetical protein n=1 Tax=Hydrocarboniphaga sp. TaxID=2033016 RepID=UPI00262664ED|nr:hypothetical protein [Hydrocarboniphaga sp.]MDB5968505.1 hypothetical protein [Hydrocarboniphaga sp.]
MFYPLPVFKFVRGGFVELGLHPILKSFQKALLYSLLSELPGSLFDTFGQHVLCLGRSCRQVQCSCTKTGATCVPSTTKYETLLVRNDDRL